jgi:hypothetical protein
MNLPWFGLCMVWSKQEPEVGIQLCNINLHYLFVHMLVYNKHMLVHNKHLKSTLFRIIIPLC